MSSQRSSRMIKEQKQILLDFFVCQHPDLANYSDLTPEQLKTLDKLWVECSAMLNTAGPPKSISTWKGCWSDLKTKTKRKALDLKYRPSNIKPLTDLEEKLLQIMNKTSFVEVPDAEEQEDEDQKTIQDDYESDGSTPPPSKKLHRRKLRSERKSRRSSSQPQSSEIPRKRIKVKSEIQDFLHEIGDNINTHHNIADALNNVARALNNLADAINNFR